jgi:hypothetical protein
MKVCVCVCVGVCVCVCVGERERERERVGGLTTTKCIQANACCRKKHQQIAGITKLTHMQ